MFLTGIDYNLEDFLTSLNFIAPKGTSIAYFIAPQAIDVPLNNFYVPQQPDYSEDESITYTRQMPILKQDMAETPPEYSQYIVDELGRKTPTPNLLPDITEPEDLSCPFIKVLSESTEYGIDIKLTKNYKMFEKGTIFHCVKNRLN